MSEGHDLDLTDDTNPDDSPIIKELRSQIRAQEKELSTLRTEREEAAARTQSMRAEAAQAVVNGFGLDGLAEDVLNWVEGEITEESVRSALEARSIPLPDSPVQPKPESSTPNASKIGQQVADAAAGGAVKDLDQRLAEATSGAEIAAIMAEANLTRSHSA